MAAKVRLIKITWENQGEFELETSLDGSEYTTILKTKENGELAQLWPSIQGVCEVYFASVMKAIGTEMKG